MSKTKFVHALVANRSEKDITIDTADKPVAIKPKKSAVVILTRKQFDEVHGVQRQAVKERRTARVARLVDFWVEQDGKRLPLD